LNAEFAAIVNAQVRRLGIPLAKSMTTFGHTAKCGHARRRMLRRARHARRIVL